MSEHIKTGNEIRYLCSRYDKDKWVSVSWLKEQIGKRFKYPPYTEYTKESNKLMNDVYYEALKDVLSLLEEK